MITWEDTEREIKRRGGVAAQDLERIEAIVNIITTIAHRREELGISQRELAKLVEIPQSSVARIESGVVFPNLDTILKSIQPLGLKLSLTAI